MKRRSCQWKRKQRLPPEERVAFILKSCTKKVGDCMEYIGHKSGTGYGKVYFQGKIRAAHRLVFQFVNKVTLTPKQLVCHKCDNRACINPDHLFLGDQLINMRDMMGKGRHKMQKTDLCKRGHAFDYKDARGNRQCSFCDKIRKQVTSLQATTKEVA